MNRKSIPRLFISTLTALTIVLAVATAADPDRRRTSRSLQPVSACAATDNMLSSLNVTAFAEDSLGRIWIGTSAGINVYDGESYLQFFHDTADSTALPDDYINALSRDSRGRIWVGTQNGVALSIGGGRFRRFRLPATDCNVVQLTPAPDGTDRMVATTDNHGNRHAYLISPAEGNQAKPCPSVPAEEKKTEVPDAPFSLSKPQALVACTFRDSRGNVWVGFRHAGYQVVAPGLTAFKRANANALARATQGRDVTGLAQVGRCVLAATTLRLLVYDTSTGHVGETFFAHLFDSVPEAHDGRCDLVPADSSHVWLVGSRQVLFCSVQGHRLKVEAKAFGASDTLTRLGAGTAAGGGLYASSSRGLLHFAPHAHAPQCLATGHLGMDEETQLATLHDGRILLFMKNLRIAIYSPRSRSVQTIADSSRMGGNADPAFAYEDSHGTVWLGTKRSGLFRLHLPSGRIERTSFLDDVHIQAVAEDAHGQLWFTTLKDVVSYSPATQTARRHPLLAPEPSAGHRQYFDKAITTTPDGSIAFGSSDGCFFTDAAAALSPDPAHAPKSGSIRLWGLSVATADRRQRFVLNGPVARDSRLTFSHDRNTLTLHFLHPDLTHQAARLFQWKLEGYDQQWQAPTMRHEATYANLAPGTYTFRLRLLESSTLPPADEVAVSICIRPPWWDSAAAWLGYALCALALVAYVNHLYLRLRVGRLKLDHARHEREREQHINEMNMDFFANISHEFRNPITLIAGPLLSLRHDASLPDAVQRTLAHVCISVNRMLRLIDQMLDFNQLETDALRLRVTPADAEAQLRTLAAAFAETARVRHIRLEVSTMTDGGETWTDADKLEKIVSNLFTNALKHTPDGGCIHLTLQVGHEEGEGNTRTLRCGVENSGSHIPEERIADVFKRYYQCAAAADTHHYGWGTGIGLYYVRRLVGLHHGTIMVSNTPEGVLFRFTLPADAQAYTSDERNREAHTAMQLPVDCPPPAAASGSSPASGAPAEGRKRLLIVDDDTDVAQYVRSIFAPHYEVVNRNSAEEALADLADIQPDIVLSDVVMGRMSGYEFCARIKADLMLSHIPVVMVTAKSDMSEQVNGLRQGAVAYVTKPFDPAYLQAIVAAQLNGIDTLRRQLGQSTATANMPETAADALAEPDRRFMDELYALMERRSAEMDLNVATVCHDLLISQSKFNYKLKQLTGDTPGTFFRKYKLNRAAQMLRQGDHTVAEVAMLTGFATAAHFSVAFKKQFGVSPSEWREKA